MTVTQLQYAINNLPSDLKVVIELPTGQIELTLDMLVHYTSEGDTNVDVLIIDPQLT